MSTQVSCTANQMMSDSDVSEDQAIAQDLEDDAATEKSFDETITEEAEPVRIPTPIQAPQFISKIKSTKV